MKKLVLTMLGLMAGLPAGADVARAKTPPVIDGRLDDACWKEARWEGGFSSFSVRAAKLAGPVPKTEFAVVADDDAVYFAVKCYDPNPAELKSRPDTSLWITDGVELHLCPTGRGFDIYHFAVSPVSKDVYAEFLSEGGLIQPDPYAPEWRHAVGIEKDAWVAEFAFPLSAFYMTRNADWKTTWLMNVARKVVNPEKTPGRTNGYYGWAQLERSFLEPKNWRMFDGFPVRRPEDDIFVRSAIAQIEKNGAEGLSGRLRLEVVSACAGRFEVSASSGEKPLEVTLRKGKNIVELPCRYRENGRFKTHIEVRNLDANRTFRRDYPVLVDFETIAVRFTKPGFRNNFYPGQNTDSVAGTVKVAGRQDAELTLEGPGFPTRTLTVRGGVGAFSFDTKGFSHGEANLIVKAGGEVVRKRIRNLPPTGHAMAWIEDGHLVVNGEAVFRRSIYADGFKQGRHFRKRFEKDLPSFCMTKGFATVKVTLTDSEERSEGVFDRRPSTAVLARIDKIIERNRDRDIVGYYIADEPECRLLSPIYLKHLYDYVAEKDPYRIIFTASRGGKAYGEIADLIETHPYMNCQQVAGGERRYGRHPRDMPRYLDDFDALDRPDKCLGFLPTCFAPRWTSVQSDYPTFDEYVAHCWGMLIAGAKTLWPYAGHDLGDREALYEGVRYVFRQTAAYEKFLLFGRHTRHPRKDDVDRGTWELDGDVLDVSVDYKTMKTTIRVPAKYNETLENYETVKARVGRGEAARLGRDNQLRGRYNDVVLNSNMQGNFGGGNYKLIDGTLDMLARADTRADSFIELSFARFTPAFDRVRVWGTGIDSMKVEIRRGGEWEALAPVSAKTEGAMRELVFDKVYTTVKMRFLFPGVRGQKNDVEVYELELPHVKESETRHERKSVAAAVDEGIVWKWDGSNAQNADKLDARNWYAGDVVAPRKDGGFTIKNAGTRYCDIVPEAKWLVMDIDAFRDKPNTGYRAWHASIKDVCYLAGTVTHPQSGIYAIELPKVENKSRNTFAVRLYGMEIDFNSIALMHTPANRVVLRGEQGKKDIGPGDTIQIEATFAEPCEDVAAEFLCTPSTGGMKPFAVNGTSAVALKRIDGEGRSWGASVKVEKCGERAARGVYLKVSPLGSANARPVFGNFQIPFVKERIGKFADMSGRGEAVPEATYYSMSDEARAYLTRPLAERCAEKRAMTSKVAETQLSDGVPLVWTATGKTPYSVTVRRKTDGKVFLWTQVDKNDLSVFNLEIGFEYAWSVIDHAGKSVGSGCFTMADVPPRCMKVSFVNNMRDLGGWRGLDGRRVRQGLVYRSVWFDNCARFKSGKDYAITFDNSPVTDSEKCDFVPGVKSIRDMHTPRTMLGQLGIRTDLDLRSPHETFALPCSPLGEAVNYIQAPLLAYPAADDVESRRCFAKAFRALLDARNYPIVFHCAGGKDRTGTLAFFMNGLLGVAMDDLRRDYEFTLVHKEWRMLVWHRDRLFLKLQKAVESCAGATLVEKFESYVKGCGFTDADIAMFRAQMLEDPETTPAATDDTVSHN